MPNSVAPRGFVPLRYLDGSNWNGATNTYCIPSTDTNPVAVGDAVKSAAGGDAAGVPYVTRASGTDTVRGVVIAVLPTAPNNPSLVGTALDLTMQGVPASKSRDYYVLVLDDPNVLFELQDDGVNALTSAACNKNASFTVTAPTSPQQNSASVLNSASVATTQSLNLKLMGLVQAPGNDYGTRARWVVRFNQHELGGCNTAGV